jgi:hypothetical protein
MGRFYTGVKENWDTVETRTSIVMDPSERITLALRPRPVPEGQDRTAAEPGRTPLPPGLDAAVYSELKQASLTFDYLKRFGEPVEFWEAVRLARSRRGVKEGADGEGAADNGLADELQAIRRQLSPMVRDLRRYLVNVPDLPPTGEPLEVALGFLLASSREHQAVAKWLAESDKHLGKAASKLRSLFEIARPYLEALRPWSLDGPRAPGAPAAPAPGAAATKGAPAAAAPAAPAAPSFTIEPELLENFRRSTVCRQIFAETELQAAFWEIHMLNTAERLPCQTRLDQIAQSKKEKQMAAFHEEARNLHARLLPLRARHGRWVDALVAYLKALPGMPKDSSLFDMALGFFVVESGAIERARNWLEQPQARAAEAADYFFSLGHRAKAYLAALR